MEKSKRDIILAIETTIGGGSLSLLEGENEIEGWTGTREISRAEDVLDEISGLLERNGIKRSQITAICVSKGAGSLTGEKIGLALAKGMHRAIGCQLIEVPMLDALLAAMEKEFQGELVTAVFTRKDRVLWQRKEKKNSFFYDVMPDPVSSNKEEFILAIKAFKFKIAVLCIPTGVNIDTFLDSEILIIRDNLAYLIGLNYFMRHASDNVK